VNPRENSSPEIFTKCNNDFNGEPDMPVDANTEIAFVPERDTW
jgi:hypothetical protein